MKEDIKLLKKEFKKIKNMGFIKSLRDGTTGLGYTFESLLNKKEDQLCRPDFGSIELKCKLGYSKSAITLFNCVPKRKGETALSYIFGKFSYHRFGRTNEYKLFERKIFSNYTIKRYGYEFKLHVNYELTEIFLKAYKNGEFIEDICSWDFRILERKLKRKLSTLAIIEGYPYKINDETYYKYMKLNIYKLKGFLEFLKLIEEDKIFIHIYIKSALDKDGKFILEDHGVGFKIKQDHVEELFYKLKQ